MYFDIWPVIAAILYTETKPREKMRYRTISSLVRRTGLTNLGRKRRRPERTVASILSQRHEFFAARYGYYGLSDHEGTQAIPQVASVLKALENNLQRENAELELQLLRAEVKSLREQVTALERKLGRIAVICKNRNGRNGRKPATPG